MKLIVETNGSIQVVGYGEDHFAHFDRPSVVVNSALMQMKIASGELVVLGQVNDNATDDAFSSHWTETSEDRDFAVQSFISEFPADEAAAKPPAEAETKKAPAKKAAAE